MKDAVLELNASNDRWGAAQDDLWLFGGLGVDFKLFICRGIDVVRNKIKMFAQQKVTLPKGRHKIIILDEADR